MDEFISLWTYSKIALKKDYKDYKMTFEVKPINLLDRFLFKELGLSTFVGSIFALVVLLGLQVLRLSDMIVRYDLALVDVAKMLWGLSISFTPLVLPIAFLFSLLFVFGRMSSDKEWIASSSMGYSPTQILRAPYLVAVVVGIATAFSSIAIGPYGNRLFEISIDEAVKRRVTQALKAGTFSEGFLDLVVFVDQIDPVSSQLKRVFVYDESNFDEDVSISAKTGIFVQSRLKGVATLQLKDGSLVSQNTKTKTIKRVDFTDYLIHADYSNVIGNARNSPPSLAFTDLFKSRMEHSLKPAKASRPFWVEMARRIAVAFLGLCFVPLTFGVSIDNSRTAKSRSVFYGLIILISYWTLYFSIVTWVLKSDTPTFLNNEFVCWLLIWMPNLFVLAVGTYLYKRRTQLKYH